VAPKLIVLGWDSATFDVAAPLMEQGRLPALARLVDGGFSAPLRSVWPPMTDCAWTSAFTGRNPGAHGIFGSWYRAPGAYECRYFSARDRRAPALWELADDQRFLVWNVPMTYPPERTNGAMVAGYGAPPGSQFCDPPGLQQTLADRWPIDDLLDRAPHSTLDAFFVDLLRGLEAQSEAIVYAAKKTEADCVAAVLPHIDRAQHFFWRFRGQDHRLAASVDVVYEATDRLTAKLMEQFPDADVIVVSDHGAGNLKADVNVGAWLAANGYATYGRRRGRLVRLAWLLPPRVRRFGRRLAPTTARRAFSATLAGQLGPFDWGATRAFVGFHGDLWLNLVEREAQGNVPTESRDALLDEIAAGLTAIVNEDIGEPVFGSVLRGDQVYSGNATDLAPDLVLDSWSTGYRVAPGRARSKGYVIAPEPLAGVDVAWSADHRPHGIFAAAGPHIAAGRSEELSLMDVCPTALALMGQPVPEGLDGRVVTEALDEAFLSAHPVVAGAAVADRAVEGAYSEEEAAAVAEHLKELGYIE
jgi:predicted AlkP superfamily phosphohydrolase/phosphomutase